METICLAGFEGGIVPSNVTIVNGNARSGNGRRYSQKSEEQNYRWSLNTSKTSNDQAEVSILVNDTTHPKVYGSFCSHAYDIPYDNDTSATPIVKFGDIELKVDKHFPSLKLNDFPNVTAGANDYTSKLLWLNWILSGGTGALTSAASSTFTAFHGVFTKHMSCTLSSGSHDIAAGKYYVARVGSHTNTAFNIPTIQIKVTGVPTTFTGTVADAAYETPMGTAVLYEIDVTSQGVIDSTVDTIIDVGDPSEASATVYWIPYKYDPRISNYYKMTIWDANSSSVLVEDASVIVEEGHWMMIRFNIDWSGTLGANDVTFSIHDGTYTTSINTTVSTARTDQLYLTLRSAYGRGSKLDDIRVDANGIKGTLPANVRGEFRKFRNHIGNEFTSLGDPAAELVTNLGSRSFNTWTIASSTNNLYAIDMNGSVWLINPETYDTTALGLDNASPYVDGDFASAHIVYDEYRDLLHAFANGKVLTINPQQLNPLLAIVIDTNPSIVGSYTNDNATGREILSIFIPQEKATYVYCSSNTTLIRFEGNFATSGETHLWPIVGGTANRYLGIEEATNTEILYDETLNTLYWLDTTTAIMKFNITLGKEVGSGYNSTITLTSTTYNSLRRCPVLGQGYGLIISNANSYKVDLTTGATSSIASGTIIYNGHYLAPYGLMLTTPNATPVAEIRSATSATYSNSANIGASPSITHGYVIPCLFNSVIGEIIFHTNQTTGSYYKFKASTNFNQINSLSYDDSSSVYTNIPNSKLTLPPPLAPNETFKGYAGKNIMFKGLRGIGSLSVTSDSVTSISGLSYTLNNKVVQDYIQHDDRPQIAWYADGYVGSNESIYPFNHGTDSGVVSDVSNSTIAAGHGVMSPTFGLTILTSSRSTLSYPAGRLISGLPAVLHVGTLGNSVGFSGHTITSSPGEFSVNICFTPTGLLTVIANSFLFKSDSTIDASTTPAGDNSLVIKCDSTTTFTAYLFGGAVISNPTLLNRNDGYSGGVHMLTIGRNSSNEILYTLNGVTANLGVNTTALNWGPIINFFSGNAYATILSFGIYQNKYVAWPCVGDAPFYGAGGPPIQIEKT